MKIKQGPDPLGTIFTRILLACCILVIITAGAGLFIRWEQRDPIPTKIAVSPTIDLEEHENDAESPEENNADPLASDPSELSEDDANDKTTETVLAETLIPINDVYQLAEKYQGVADVPVMLQSIPVVYQNGTTREFWILNVDSNRYRLASAALVYQTPHLYFWVEEGMQYAEEDVKQLADTFENKIYPRNQYLFGTEFSPGIDNDLHLTILYAEQLGGAAGYFSSADSYIPDVQRYSNQSEMFYLSADYIDLSNDYVYGVMAHEFQHMIHWNIDRDESAWINEGLSELAVDLNGYNTGGFSTLFALEPDMQLNFWPGAEQGSATPHYGASYLFIKYLHTLYGDAFIKDLVAEEENGFKGLEAAYKKHNPAADEEMFPAELLFQRWSIENFIYSRKEIEKENAYHRLIAELPFESTVAVTCGDEPLKGDVHQFGSEYITIDCKEDFEIVLGWEPSVPILPIDAHSGRHYFWSNRGHDSAMRLSRQFDLTLNEGPIALSYWVWYDIERDYDYLYVNVSENGRDWENIETPTCTTEDPTGANYGCGYNGKSNGWVREQVDLSRFAGKEVTIQFEYITDAAVNGEGLVVDDISVEAIGYHEDFEKGAGGWEAEGFVQIENTLPQRMGISVLRGGKLEAGTPQIQHVPSQIRIPISGVQPDEAVILVLSGLARDTHIPAPYQLAVQELD